MYSQITQAPISDRYGLQREITRLPNLLAYYPCNELEGTTCRNYAPANRGLIPGVISGATLGSPGLRGRAYSFNKTNNNVETAAGTQLQLLSSLSIGILVKTGSDITTAQALMGRGKDGSNARDYLLIIQNSKTLFQRSDGGSFPAVTGNITLAINTWYFIMVTFNGTTAIIYVNNAVDNSGNVSLSVPSDASRITSIGSIHQSAGNTFFYGGLMQHAFLSNQVYTTAQIRKLNHIAGFI